MLRSNKRIGVTPQSFEGGAFIHASPKGAGTTSNRLSLTWRVTGGFRFPPTVPAKLAPALKPEPVAPVQAARSRAGSQPVPVSRAAAWEAISPFLS
ncbi:MAG TPA: hypothetical protein VL996_03380, partial [Methylocella sp.]|nr:hypothetical protein [Methylocella sp.]